MLRWVGFVLIAATLTSACQVYDPDLIALRRDGGDVPSPGDAIDAVGPDADDAPTPDAVDARDAPSGRCGDRMLTAGETCDDGNTVSGDGCSSTCQLDVDPPLDRCPGTDIRVSMGTQIYTGSTIGAGTPPGGCVFGMESPGRLYALTFTAPGRLTIRIVPLQPAFNVAAATSAMMCTNTGYTCVNFAPAGVAEMLPVQMIAGDRPVYIVVKGANTTTTDVTTGDYRLELTFTP